MKKITMVSIIITALIVSAGCSNTADKAVEQAKLSIASSDYQTALNSLELAKQEGAKSGDVDTMILILQNYINAKSAFDADDLDGAESALRLISSEYTQYTIKKDIDDLKNGIEAKRLIMADIDAQISGLKILIAEGDYVSAAVNISELYTKELTEYQRNQVDQLNSTVQSAKNKIDEAENKKPDIVYVTQPPVQRNEYVPPVNGNTNVVATYYVVNCQTSITLRTQPSTKASEITQIPLGKPVGYIENAGNGFLKINYDGAVGYALASYLSPNKQNSYTQTISRPARVVNAESFITLRSAASTKASEITKIPVGSYVTYLGDTQGEFYHISYSGMTGYALKAYIELQ